MNRVSLTFLLFPLLFLLGCEEQNLLEKLDSRESIEIAVRLREAGVRATRESNGQGRNNTYNIVVPQDDYNRGLKILHELRLPKTKGKTLEDITEAKGFVPNSREISTLRLDHALALQVERLLEAMPGVIEARAIIRSNLQIAGSLPTKSTPASASIVIRYQTKAKKQPFTEEEIRQIVLQTVPGLSPESISITTTQIFVPFGGAELGEQDYVTLWPFKFEISKVQERSAARQLSIGLILAIVCGIILGMAGQKGVDSYGRRGLTKADHPLLNEELGDSKEA